jgi:Uma2 family endonuclease
MVTLCAPRDAAFVRRDQLPPEGIGSGWMKVAPDLVVEVRSPDETQRDVDEKLRDYQIAGTRHRWIIDLETRTVLLTSDGSPDLTLTSGTDIDNVEVLPGFTLRVATLFVGLASVSASESG